MAKIKYCKMGYYFDFMTDTLYMTYRFSMRANDVNGDEFKTYESFKERLCHILNLHINRIFQARKKLFP